MMLSQIRSVSPATPKLEFDWTCLDGSAATVAWEVRHVRRMVPHLGRELPMMEHRLAVTFKDSITGQVFSAWILTDKPVVCFGFCAVFNVGLFPLQPQYSLLPKEPSAVGS